MGATPSEGEERSSSCCNRLSSATRMETSSITVSNQLQLTCGVGSGDGCGGRGPVAGGQVEISTQDRSPDVTVHSPRSSSISFCRRWNGIATFKGKDLS